MFRFRFGGNIAKDLITPERPRPVFRWWVSGDDALEFFKAIEPHIYIKHEQVLLAIHLKTLARSNPDRMSIGAAIKSLKHIHHEL